MTFFSSRLLLYCFFQMIFVSCLVSSAIRCHSCNSEYDPRCGDPFDPFSIGQVNCSFISPLDHMKDVEPTLCRKTTQKGKLIDTVPLPACLAYNVAWPTCKIISIPCTFNSFRHHCSVVGLFAKNRMTHTHTHTQ